MKNTDYNIIRFLIIGWLILFNQMVIAQELVKNPDFRQEGSNLIITYELTEKSDIQVYLYYQGRRSEITSKCSGDVGSRIRRGKRTIVYPALSDFGEIQGDVYFSIKAISRIEENRRNSAAMLASAIVPGLGQMGKGNPGEGIVTFLGEAALIGGAVACYSAARDKLSVINDEESSYSQFESAYNDYNNLQNVSYILIGSAGAFYVWNLCRAYFMKDKKSEMLSIVPSVQETTGGIIPTLLFAYKF